METKNPFIVPNGPASPYAGLESSQGAVAQKARYYAVSLPKLVALSVSTIGFYAIYWMYKQWDALRDSNAIRSGSTPILRGLFALFFFHDLFAKIRAHVTEAGLSSRAASSALATLAVILILGGNVLAKQPEPLAFLCFVVQTLLVLPLAIAQSEINNYTRAVDPAAKLDSRFSAGTILVIVLGLLIWATMILAFLLPAPTEVP
jgi:hypothetical protein